MDGPKVGQKMRKGSVGARVSGFWCRAILQSLSCYDGREKPDSGAGSAIFLEKRIEQHQMVYKNAQKFPED